MNIHNDVWYSYFAALFQTPVVPASTTVKSPVAVGFACASPRSQMQNLPTSFTATSQTGLTSSTSSPYVSTPHAPLTPLPCRSSSPIVPVTSISTSVPSTTFRQSPSPNTSLPYVTSHSPNVLQVNKIIAVAERKLVSIYIHCTQRSMDPFLCVKTCLKESLELNPCNRVTYKR